VDNTDDGILIPSMIIQSKEAWQRCAVAEPWRDYGRSS